MGHSVRSPRDFWPAALSLILIGAVDLVLIAAWTTDWVTSPWLVVQMVVALLLFSVGYLFLVLRTGLLGFSGARLGATAGVLNTAPLLFSRPTPLVVGFLALAACAALLGALLLGRQAVSASR